MSVAFHEQYLGTHSLESSDEQRILDLQRPDFLVGSIHDTNLMEEVVERMDREGIGVGGFNQTVCYVIGHASDQRFIDSVVKLKGPERKSMALALTHTADVFTPYVDLQAIPQQMRQYFEDPVLMEDTFGELAFLRVPVRKDRINDLPSQVVSGSNTDNPMIQNWIPTNAMEPLVRKMEQRGMLVGITSLNKHGMGSTTNQLKGGELARESLGAYLYDPIYPNDVSQVRFNGKPKLPYGSYPIIEIGNHLDGEHGVSLVRHGPYDHRAISALFPGGGISVDPSKREEDSIDFPDEIIAEIERAKNPQQVRLMVISFLKGLLST